VSTPAFRRALTFLARFSDPERKRGSTRGSKYLTQENEQVKTTEIRLQSKGTTVAPRAIASARCTADTSRSMATNRPRSPAETTVSTPSHAVKKRGDYRLGRRRASSVMRWVVSSSVSQRVWPVRVLATSIAVYSLPSQWTMHLSFGVRPEDDLVAAHTVYR
jgi:hypothetical protein